MSVKKFKFVSPGVFVNEIDNSQIPKAGAGMGPVIIGRSRKGPGMQPVQVQSFSEFVEVFGTPIATSEGSDAWRTDLLKGPTYAAYAAQAYLANSTPLTFMRLLGEEHSNRAATNSGRAGWKIGSGSNNDCPPANSNSSTGGAYGLFLIASGTAEQTPVASRLNVASGTLGAIWYFKEGGIVLSGSQRGKGGTIGATGSNIMIQQGTDRTYKAMIYDGSDTIVHETEFNFNPTSDKHIRKVFNTDPTLMNSSLVDSNSSKAKTYFLGPSYERMVHDKITSTTAGEGYGVILGLGSGSVGGSDFRMQARAAQTGWVIAQDLRATAGAADGDKDGTQANLLTPTFDPGNSDLATRLFKFHTLNGGSWEQRNLKISIADIKASPQPTINPYGTFTVLLRRMWDSDNKVQLVEQFNNCSLNPNAPNYIAKKIGDKYQSYDTTRKRLVSYGNYDNRSSHIRVEMAAAVDKDQHDATCIPFGFIGPLRYKSFTIYQDDGLKNPVHGAGAHKADTSGSLGVPYVGMYSPDQADNQKDLFIRWGAMSASFDGGRIFRASGSQRRDSDEPSNKTRNYIHCGNDPQGAKKVGGKSYRYAIGLTASIEFPRIALRSQDSHGGLKDPTEAYWGYDTSQTGALTNTFDQSNFDLLRPLAEGGGTVDSFTAGALTEPQCIFTLDDLSGSADGEYHYVSGSRAAGNSKTAIGGGYTSILDAGMDRFTMPLMGGFDGLDVTEAEPFNQTRALPSSATEKANSEYFSIKRAVDILADPEYVEYNILTAPGIVNENLTTHMIDVCEERGDALAIIDPNGGYTPNTEDASSEESRIGTVTTVANNMRDRALNTSYGASYFPWVRIKDTINNNDIYAPPSIAALGALSYSQAKSDVWFAPAGFNRGGLEGTIGVPVLDVRTHLTSDERDKLYENNINPIAKFPNEGIVVFGQKTLQVTPSALDRINVRRLMIFVKKEISRIANGILFDQNVQTTWDRFLSEVNPFLSDIQIGGGLSAYKVVLDETTTTADLIDRNILYAKIFLQPARAIEFIALDFTIQRTGAAFED